LLRYNLRSNKRVNFSKEKSILSATKANLWLLLLPFMLHVWQITHSYGFMLSITNKLTIFTHQVQFSLIYELSIVKTFFFAEEIERAKEEAEEGGGGK
jgi:hypothetical protein